MSEEEVTDDEVYLKRHEKAFSDFLNQSFSVTKKRLGQVKLEEDHRPHREDSMTFIKIHLQGDTGTLASKH